MNPNAEIYEFPVVVNGKKITTEDVNESYEFKFDDVVIKLPKANNYFDEICKKKNTLRNLSSCEIIDFFSKVGKLWGNPDYYYRKLLFELGPKVTGHSRELYFHDVSLIYELTCIPEFLHDILQCELGSDKIMDEWVSKYNADVHAEPLGNLLHIIAGNVPIVGIYSIVRGILTKNRNILKLPQRELLTTLFFVLSFFDADEDSEVLKNTSILYWEHNDEAIKEIIGSSNGMCLWGGAESVKFYKELAPIECSIVEYGPRISVHFLVYDENSKKDLALRTARDICVYDQDACLSPQVIYVKGDTEEFCRELSMALEVYQEHWPKEVKNIDQYAHMNFVKYSNTFAGNSVYNDPNMKWMVVNVTSTKNIKLEHPLGRTVFIVKEDDFSKIVNTLPSNVQTIGIEPEELKYELRNLLAARGIRRISNIGYNDATRLGCVHDGNYLTSLVKFVSMEKTVDFKCKSYVFPEGFFESGLIVKPPVMKERKIKNEIN